MKQYDATIKTDFRRNPHKGLYIAIEGIDGAGKTVQSERLMQYFRDKGTDTLLVNEPRRTGLIGRVINEFLQNRIKLPKASLQYLMSADRIAHQEEVVLPALEKGQAVLSHRCFWSAVPYGIMDRSGKTYNYEAGETLLVSLSILSLYHQIVVPDVTFYLDISGEEAIKRLKGAGNVEEYYETQEKLDNVRKGYQWMIKKFPSEFVVIDGMKSFEEITKEIISHVESIKK
jgi:dTMP kinase